MDETNQNPLPVDEEENPQPKTEGTGTPEPVGSAASSGMGIKLSPAEIKSYLFNVGKAYNQGGMTAVESAINSNPGARAMMSDAHIAHLATDPNKRNDNPVRSAVNGLAGSFHTSNQVQQVAEKVGYDPTPGASNDPQSTMGFMNGVKQVFGALQDKPGSPEAIANQAYFGALTRGAGIPAAADAYVKTYQQIVQTQQTAALDMVKKQNEYLINNQDRIEAVKGMTGEAAKILSSSGLPVNAGPQSPLQGGQAQQNPQQQQAPIDVKGMLKQVQQIGMIAHSGKDGSMGQASAMASTLLNQLVKSGASEDSINGVARLLGGSIKLDGDKQKAMDVLETVGQLSRTRTGETALAKLKFGIPLTDAEQAAYEKAQARIEETNNRQVAGKKAAEVGGEAQGLTTPVDVGGGKKMTPMAIQAQAAGMKSGAEAGARMAQEEKYAGKIEFNKETAKQLATTLAEMPGDAALAKKFATAIDIIDSGKHNIGAPISTATITRPFGNAFSTQAAQNTKDVDAAVQQIVLKTQQLLKGSTSDKDLNFILQNKPDITKDDPQRIKRWLQDSAGTIAMKQQIAQGQAQRMGITAPTMPKPVGGATEPAQEKPRVRVYNPATGKLE